MKQINHLMKQINHPMKKNRIWIRWTRLSLRKQRRLCREMAMSRTLFYGKLKTLTGQGPQDFMRLIRLEQAAQYLKQGDSVLDVSVKTGFVNVKYFSTVFKKHFGVSPSRYE